MYPTMPHMRKSVLLSRSFARRYVEIVRVAGISNLPRFHGIRYQLRLEGALMNDSITASAKSRSYVVIPARYASTRLPRKMLLRETGKTLFEPTEEASWRPPRPTGRGLSTDPVENCREVES